MKIRSIEAVAVSLPMLKPVIMAGEEIRRADNVLVRIEADGNVLGWGEAAPAPMHTGDTLEGIVAAVEYMRPVLLARDPRDIVGALVALDHRMYGNHGAKAGIEIALHDLAGKLKGVPVHALLGKKVRNDVPLLSVIGGGDFDGDLRDAQVKKQAGVTAYKIKVGIDGPQKDAERTREICKILGNDTLISADANQGYTADEALAYVRAVDGSGLDFFEQPVMADDLDAMARIAAATKIAIGADEGIHSIGDIEVHHRYGAARGVSLKAIKLGGLRGVKHASELCDRLGMDVNISCKTGESSIACAAALHTAAVVPKLAWALTLTHIGLAEDIVSTPLRVANGRATLPDLPGLGIEVDEEQVARHRIAVATTLPGLS